MEGPFPVDTEDSPPIDGHGRAALLLVESLIHGLAERSILTVAEAVSIMETALDAQIAITDDAARPTSSMRQAGALLSALVESLRIDLPAES
jgi:hypothetical protein